MNSAPLPQRERAESRVRSIGSTRLRAAAHVSSLVERSRVGENSPVTSNRARDAIARFHDGHLGVEDVLRELVGHGSWLVLADAARLSAIVIGGKPQIWAFTDRDALDVFLAAGGGRIRLGDGRALADAIETWSHGFYIFHDFGGEAECIRVNPLCGAPIAFDVDPQHFALARRIGRAALVADVLAAGPADPRFRTVLASHDDYRIIVTHERLLSVELENGTRAVAVFTSQDALDRFLAKHPADAEFAVAGLDASGLFDQLREHQLVFDMASPHQLAIDRTIADFVLPRQK
jgi:hypothetical protein